MRIAPPRPRPHRESTVTLINVVFLMLVFFLIAGTLTPPLDAGVTPIRTEDAEPAAPPDALFITAEGQLRHRGIETGEAAFVALRRASSGDEAPPVRLVPDRDLAAERLIDIVAGLRAAGAGRIAIVTERTAR